MFWREKSREYFTYSRGNRLSLSFRLSLSLIIARGIQRASRLSLKVSIFQSGSDEKDTMGIRLYVGNLPFNVTEAELREHFSTIGPVAYISIPTDRETGRQRGFAFVELKDRAQADEAILRFNNQSFKGRTLSVSEARERNESQRAAPSRPSSSRPTSAAGAENADPPRNKPSRNFGPDKPSRRGRGKSKGEFKAERGPKGPMRERVRGQFLRAVDDDDNYDDYNDDYDDYDDEVNEEDVDAGVSDSEKDA
jgi:cold-inducible RNA-binding protein